MRLVRIQCRASLFICRTTDYTHTYQDPAARMELPFGFRRMSQLMEGGVMGAPLQERLRSKFGILKNDKVMYKMELDGSGVSMDVEDKDDFDDFTNYLKGRGSLAAL